MSNITEWGLRQFREHYGDDGISAEDVFAYTYAVLNDPAYRQRYEIHLRREFPACTSRRILPGGRGKGGNCWICTWALRRRSRGRWSYRTKLALNPRVLLRADKERGIIQLDDRTALAGVPPEAWEYQLGGRSALEWVLDQYKERKPRDPTIAERFNTYRFADHKEHVINLLGRVCAVGAFTTSIVDELGVRSWVS